jgi:hypothetical protein
MKLVPQSIFPEKPKSWPRWLWGMFLAFNHPLIWARPPFTIELDK